MKDKIKEFKGKYFIDLTYTQRITIGDVEQIQPCRFKRTPEQVWDWITEHLLSTEPKLSAEEILDEVSKKNIESGVQNALSTRDMILVSMRKYANQFANQSI